MRARKFFIVASVLCVGTLLASSFSVSAQQQKPAAVDPVVVLAKLLNEKDRRSQEDALLTLRATGDKELAPFFDALTKSGDPWLRRIAVVCLAEIAGKDATPALADRFLNDSDSAVRIEALTALLRLETIPDDPLRDALTSNDEKVRCLAARAMVKRGHLDDAKPALRAMIESREPFTAAMSRMSLLAAGDAAMLEPLRNIVRDPASDPMLVAMLIEQAMELKVKAAAPLLEDVLAAAHLDDLMNVRAYRALAALDAAPGPRLGKAIADSDNRTFQCLMMRVLSERPDAAASLERLAKEKGLPGVLARIELARRDEAFKGLAAPLAEAVELGHPIVMEYVLNCATIDAKKNLRASDVYTPALLTFIESVSRDEVNMTREHIQAALAVKWLVELGSPQAVEGLKKLVTGRYDAVLRLTATGLYKADPSDLACDLATPLLKSPYPGIQQDAVLTLARNGDKRAASPLADIITTSDRTPALQTAAAWNLLRVQGKTTQAVAELAKQVK